ncbi:MAG: 16S rRNA (cytidine(1402)-2'-O)-methyltransferase [Parachlamydiaceae bacterium]|nr:16S rRNA (cytidine(1402)-2'-O)-methyltransferase [Parachlamydiaceae bacterium]
MLYLVATPIGNLADITFRAIETLKNCDYILCEDTRHSLILLQHYQIQKPLKSYHKFNEASTAESILHDLREGKNICLISDAGTPAISDPGADLVKLCIENELPVTAIPGPCAAIQAISCSGLPTDRFQFLGFLPKKEEELKRCLFNIFNYPGTTLCYESPHRLIDVLELIHKIEPDSHLVVARELTKKFEEIVRGSASFLIEYWKNHPLKGEIVLLFSPTTHSKEEQWTQLTPQEHVKWIEETYGLTRKDAIKLAAEQRNVPKRQIYNEFI